MAEEFNKDEDATPHKLNEARKKGQVAKSQELPSFFSLFAMISALAVLCGSIAGVFSEYMSWWLLNAEYLAKNDAELVSHFTAFLSDLGIAILPVFLSGLIAAVIASMVNTGPVFSFFPIKPDFTKINPAKGFKRVFSRKSLVELCKLIFKLGMFVGVAYACWVEYASYILNPALVSVGSAVTNWKSLFFILAYFLLVVFVLSAVFDVWFSRKEFSKQMKMSKRDVKDEYKRREGDPEIKAKRKKALSELIEKAVSTKDVKDADVVITNPTHVAVALQYRPGTMRLPIVLSKGQGLLAAKIRYEAKKHKVPIMRKPNLARQLLKKTKIGDPIDSDEQYKVASVYRWVVAMPNNRVMG